MVSKDQLRHFSFFQGLTEEQLSTVASVSRKLEVEEGYLFFAEGDQVDFFYVIEEGQVHICVDVVESDHAEISEDDDEDNIAIPDDPDPLEQENPCHILSFCELGPGELFGWTSLLPPFITRAGALAQTACRIIAIDTRMLETYFDRDPQLAFQMALKTAMLTRDRLRDLRLTSLKLSRQDKALAN